MASLSKMHVCAHIHTHTHTSYFPRPCDLEIAREKDYHCFPANEYNVSHPILLNVTSPGYYSVYVFGGDYSNLVFSVTARTYNSTTIAEYFNMPQTEITLTPEKEEEVQVSELWKFTEEPCILFESHCLVAAQIETDWTIVAVNRRTDVLFFPGLLIIISVIALIPLIVISVCWCFRTYKRRCVV